MGFFSTKKKTFYSAGFTPIVEEDKLPNTILSSIVKSIIGHKPVVPNLLNDVANGPPSRVMRYIKRALKNKYPYGVPKHNLQDTDYVQNVFNIFIESITNPAVTVHYAKIMPYHERHWMWDYLTNTKNYNQSTNIVETTNLPYTVYVSDIIPILDGYVEDSGDPLDPNDYTLPDPETYTDWETPAKDRTHPWRGIYPGQNIDCMIRTNGDEGTYVELVFENTDSIFSSDIQSCEIELAHEVEFPDEEFYQAKFTWNPGSGDVTEYFTYVPGTGTHVDLDDAFGDTPTDVAEFLPFLHIRKEGSTLTGTGQSGTTHYIETKKMFDIVGMDMDSITEEIENNPDIGAIQEVTLMSAFKLDTNSKWGRKYLYFFFRWLKTIQVSSSYSKKSITFRDGFTRYTLSYRYLSEPVIITGVVGEVGEYFINRTTNSTYVDATRDGVFSTFEKLSGSVTFRRQITETQYEEFILDGPAGAYRISNGDRNVATMSDWDDDEFAILVPVSKMIIDTYFKFPEREKVFYASLGIMTTTRVRVKIKWYQKESFGVFLKIVAIVLLIVSLGSAASASYGLAGLAASLGGGVYVIAIAIIQELLINLAISYTFKIIIKEVGVELGFAFALLAIAAGGYYGITEGLTSNMAMNLIKLGTVASTATTEVLNEEIEDINYASQEYAENAEKELDRINELLEAMNPDTSDLLIDPYIFMSPNETPKEWINRLSKSGNIGVLALSYPSKFADLMLKLPEPEYTDRREV